MSGINISREVLYHRHRLSRQQIGELLHDHKDKAGYDEKISQLGRVARFLEITGELQKSGIWFVPLKGPLLSWRIYGDPTSRLCHDFDFLVKPGELAATIRLLLKSGYQPVTFEWPENKHLQKMILSGLNQYDLFHPIHGLTVEIHWRLFKYPVSDPVTLGNALRDHIRQVHFAGRQFLQFTPEFELLYLCIHGGIHKWRRLKWLVDVNDFIKRNPVSPERFRQLVVQFQAMRMTGLCNALLRHFFPGDACLPVTHQVPGWVFRSTLALVNNENDTHTSGLPGIFRAFHYRMWAFPDFRYKWGRFLGYFEFSPKDLRHRWIPPYLFFFTLFRIGRGLATPARKWLTRTEHLKTTQYVE